MSNLPLTNSITPAGHSGAYPPTVNGAGSTAELLARITKLESELEERERQIDAMRRTCDTLFTSPSVDDLVRNTLEIAIDVLGANAGSLLLFNENTGLSCGISYHDFYVDAVSNRCLDFFVVAEK